MIKLASVTKIYDKGGADRIYTYIPNVDDTISKTEKRNLTFPLLPKYFQSKPKVGEMVLVFTVHKTGEAETNDNIKQRFYIGPIISQPQFMKGDSMENSTSPLNIGGDNKMSPNVNCFDTSNGALSNDDDIALYGRNGTDLFLGDNDIRIRCGCRLYTTNSEVGKTIKYNDIDGAFIQMKYFPNDLTVKKKIYSNKLNTNKSYESWQDGSKTFSTNSSDAIDNVTSVINLVASDINLISTKDFNEELYNGKTNNIKDEDLTNLIYQCHPIVYGDKLAEILGTIINAILNHVHNWGPATPCESDCINKLMKINLNDMLSNNVKTS